MATPCFANRRWPPVACGLHAHVPGPRWLQLNRLCSTVAWRALRRNRLCSTVAWRSCLRCQYGWRVRASVEMIMELCSAAALVNEIEHMFLTRIDLDVIVVLHVPKQAEFDANNAVTHQGTCLVCWHAPDKTSPIVLPVAHVDFVHRILEAELSQPSLLLTCCLSAPAWRP